MSCAGGEKGLVVFAVVDDDVTDDIPDSPAAIAEGFRNANAHYIGNVALEELNITSAKMCLERSKAGGDARCAKTCVELLESDFEYGGLTPPFSSELKKAIWALTGQVDGHAAGDSDEIFHARKIDWVGDAKTCAATPVGDLCWSCATANETQTVKSSTPRRRKTGASQAAGWRFGARAIRTSCTRRGRAWRQRRWIPSTSWSRRRTRRRCRVQGRELRDARLSAREERRAVTTLADVRDFL